MSTTDPKPGPSGSGEKPPAPRPISTTSSQLSQLSISDRMTDGDEEDIRLPTTTSSASSEVDLQPTGCGQVEVEVGQQSDPQQQLDQPPPKSRPESGQSLTLSLAPPPQSPPGPAKTTTISTIAMESNTSPPGSGSKCSPTRLVIALLQTPHRGLLLKVIELSPPLLKLPDNIQDAEDYLKNHSQCIKNLQSKQSPVEELLRQADNLIATQKPRAEVYAAMADSLGQTWKDLNGILEERRLVLQLSFNAHMNISSCLQKMDQVHAFYSRLSYLGGLTLEGDDDDDEDEVNGNQRGFLRAEEKLAKLKSDRAVILRSVAHCLESCDLLLSKIADYNYSIDSRDLVLIRDVEFATRQVHRWLEKLHDRRVILDDRLRNKREELEEFYDNSKLDQEILELAEGLGECAKFSEHFNFGDSVPSAEQRRVTLTQVGTQLKNLQERALSTAKRLEDAEYGRFSQRYGLKNKIYEILSQTNDLLTLGLELESSLDDAKEFFRLGELANAKLDAFSSRGDPEADSVGKTELNKTISEALSKGQVVLQAYGWDDPKTKGIRAVHDSLLGKKNAILEELDHLAVLDEYNDFLECVNQTYQNILNIETSRIRQPLVVPPSPREAVKEFQSLEGRTLAEVRNKVGLDDSLLGKLQNIYPDLSEEEKVASEEKINGLKKLSNLIVDLLQNRVELGEAWGKILDIYGQGRDWDREGTARDLAQVKQIFQNLQPLLEEIHLSDPDLVTGKMEAEAGRIIKELEDKGQTFQTGEKIRDICQKYKVKLDHHLLGDGSSQQKAHPQYYPVITREDVVQAFNLEGQSHQESSKVSSINKVLHQVIKPKLENTLVHFFQPLLTSYRQEILDVQDPSTPPDQKTQEEQDLERYCDRLKESYVTVTAEIESYLGAVLEICSQVEGRLAAVPAVAVESPPPSVQELQVNIEDFDIFRQEISERIRTVVGPRFDHLLQTIRHEEPPQQGAEETEALRMMMARLGHDEELDGHRDQLTSTLRDTLVHNDLNLISAQLGHLIGELEQPTNYGNCLEDATDNLENYQRFEQTVEKLRGRLTEMLATSAIPEGDAQAAAVRDQLKDLREKRAKRKNLILLSLEYFRLIEQSVDHYEAVNKNLEKIRAESKDPSIAIPRIETLLAQIQGIKKEEQVQEGRLAEIERISNIIFERAQPSSEDQHEPLRQKNVVLTGELSRVESDLTELLGFIKNRSLMDDIKNEATYGEQILSRSPIPGKNTTSLIELREPTLSRSPIPGSTVEIREITETLEVRSSSTIRRSLSPQPQQPLPTTSTLEKQTQFENTGEEEQRQGKPIKIERDTLTQTLEERFNTCETQTGAEHPPAAAAPRNSSRANIDPAWIEPLKDVVVNEGERVVLECRATGEVYGVTWFKDGVEVTARNTDYATEWIVAGSEPWEGPTTLTARLMIEEVVQGDAAIFTVRASGGENNSVVVETSGKVSVKEPVIEASSGLRAPSFLPHPPISYGHHGKAHCLELRVDGNPLPTVQWFKNGVCIDTSPDYIITFNNGLCQISFDELLKELDEGLYSCSAGNKVGEVETHVELQIKGDGSKKAGLRQRPRITRPLPKTVLARAGPQQGLRLEVEYDSATDCNIIWFKDDAKVLTTANSPAQMKTTGSVASLAFKELTLGDAGKYTVLLRNSVGEVQSESNVVVKGPLPQASDKSRSNSAEPEPKPLVSEAVSEPEPKKVEAPVEEDNSATETDSLLKMIKVESPVVKMRLQNCNDVAVGSTLKLDCVIVGQPEPEVIWFKDSRPVKEGPNHHLHFKGDRCSLVIKTVSPGDAGDYFVVAINDGGQVSSSCSVKVAAPSAAAEPAQVVPKVEEEVANVVDKLDKLKEQDKKGKSDKEEVEDWGDDDSVVERPSFKTIIQDEMITAGDRFEFRVELEPDCDKGTEVVWFKNNKKIQPGNGIELKRDVASKSYSLIFNEVKLSDKGNYLAKATNSVGDAKCFACLIVKENLELPQKHGGGGDAHPWEETTTTLESRPLPPMLRSVQTSKPARFITALEGRMVDEGEYNVTLKCVVEANPPAQLKWTKNNGVGSILPSPNLEEKYNERTGDVELLLKKVSIGDAGRYCCTASNDFGLATSVCDLVVKKIAFPPVFSKRLQSLSLEEGKRLYLEVDVYGKPPPEIGWWLNGQKLESGQGDLVMRSDTPTRHSLIVAKVDATSHSGEYLVTARNEAGEASSSCRVNVIPGSVAVYKVPPPPVPPKPRAIPTPSPEPQQPRFNVPSLARLIEDLPRTSPSITQTMSTFSESLVSHSIATILAPSAPPRHLVTTSPFPPPHNVDSVDDDLNLEPGTPPQILIAPSPTKDWSARKNQVQEKVKNFEVRCETPDLASPPSGGVRLIPLIKESPQPQQQQPKVVDLPILPLQPFPYSSTSPGSPFPPSSILLGGGGEPKQYYDSSWTSSKEVTATPGGGVSSTESSKLYSYSTTEVLIKPSKFIPEKMRESDYDSSDVEGGGIPVKWTPRGSPMSPTPTFQPLLLSQQQQPPPTTSSAFASCKPMGGAPTSLFSSQQASSSFQSSSTLPSGSGPVAFPTFVKPTVPPKPRNLSATSPLPSTSTSATPERVRSLVKSWPPVEQQEQSEPGQQQQQQQPPQPARLLSPGGGGGGDYLRNARSPTPSREALEMDKLWSRPIRFSSPTKFGSSGIRSPPPQPSMSPRPSPAPPASTISTDYTTTYPSSTQPTWAQARGGYTTPIELSSTSPLPPRNQDQQGPMSPEPLYYVSVVSTPRTTPIPPPFSPPPPPLPHERDGPTPGETRNFQEKKSFFEQTSSSSYSAMMEERSYHHTSSSSTSSSFFKGGPKPPGAAAAAASTSSFPSPPSSSLLDSSFLPPPGEAPEFLYAPPPQRQTTSISPGGATTRTHQLSTSFSSMTTSTSKITKVGDSKDKQKEIPSKPGSRVQILQHEIHITPPTPPPAASTPILPPTKHSSQLIPYIKPSKFTPHLDFASSSSSQREASTYSFEEALPPTWNPEGTSLTTTWKRVSNSPAQRRPNPDWRKSDPCPEGVVGGRRASHPLTILVEERMQDLNQSFKNNITRMTQGLCYNKADRATASQLPISATINEMANLQKAGSSSSSSVEANPLIYFKYDFGYEFGIADPKSVVVRGASEPRENFGVSSLRSIQDVKSGADSQIVPNTEDATTGVIHIPIIHEKSGK